jgi:MoxR-like ATPase
MNPYGGGLMSADGNDLMAEQATSSLHDATVLAERLLGAIDAVVLGQHEHIRLVTAAVLARGHVLLEDAPGVGKTLLAKSMARALGGTVGRVQGTADLLPSDVTGVTTYDQSTSTWSFRPGPILNNVLLVDEINRATPRAQSALLEAMGELTVTVDATTHTLPTPFSVIATQNPLGDVGTFPLVAGQLDRFAVSLSLGRPDRPSERALMTGIGGSDALDRLEPITSPAEFVAASAAIATHVVVADVVYDYVLDLADALRATTASGTAPSPRAVLTLLSVAKAHAVADGRSFLAPDDIQQVAVAVLGHRLSPTGVIDDGRALVAHALGSVPVPLQAP